MAGLFLVLTAGIASCEQAESKSRQNADSGEAPPSADAGIATDAGDGDAAAPVDSGQPEPAPVVVTIGPTSHALFVAAEASPSELKAAEDFRHYFKECFGADITTANGAPAEGTPLIVIGLGAQAQTLGVAPTPEQLGEQGYVIRTVPPHVIIGGTRQAGTLYAVHRFLEDYFGVRWYAPGVTRVPGLKAAGLPALARVEQPAFLWRHTSYEWPGQDDDFRARMGDNNGGGGADHPYGRQYSISGGAHSYFEFISPDEYFDEHPEYFSEIGGVRIREETQLCLTNPEILEIVTQKMLAKMAAEPDVHQYRFSQMDHYNACQCDKCRAINEQYGTAGGTQFWFVNQLAARTAAVYPDKLIGTLAYIYTEEPPVGLTMHPNVAVWLCHMYPSCDSHPIATCPLNAAYKRRATTWSALTSHLYIWHYVTNFTHYYNPFPNFRALAADVKFYRDLGVEGIYLQGMGHPGGGGEFSLLRPYYGMKLLLNPDLDPVALRRDFLRGYYGDAGPPIEQYIEMLHDKVEHEDIHMHLYTNPAQGYLTDDVMDGAADYFDDAEKSVADNPEMLERVKVARMPLTYAGLFPRNGYAINRGRIEWLSEIAPLAEVQEFIARMKAHGFTTTREASGEPETLMLLYMLIASNPKVYTISNGVLTVEVAPNLGGRALRITDEASGECATAYNVKEGLFFPFSGGLEDRVGEDYIASGWVEPATVKQRSDTSITLSQDTLSGYLLEKTYSLAGDEPALQVTSTVTNTGEDNRETRLRSHLEIDLGDLPGTRVSFVNRAGLEVEHDMKPVIAGWREGIYYNSLNAPQSAWTFSGSKGLALTQRFADAQVDFTRIYSYPETLHEVEVEVWARRAVLAPGESLDFTQEIEIRPAD